MSGKTQKIHLEIQTSAKNPVGILRSSFRNAQGKTMHKQYGRITGKTLSELKLLRLAFQDKVVSQDSPLAFQILESKLKDASVRLII